MTEAEGVLWRLLRQSFPQHYFRKQVPIRHYIADFASHRAKLIIEVDGGQHSAEIDEPRTLVLNGEGYRVLRFWNNEVLGNPDGVCSVIHHALHEHHPHLASPIEGEE